MSPTSHQSLVVQLATDCTSLLTRAAAKRFGGSLYASVLGQLVYVDKQGRLRPGLVSKWYPSNDFKDWTLVLRPGTFHNGRPYTAEDLRYSLLRYFETEDIPVERQYLRILRGCESGSLSTSSIEVVDSLTLILHLAGPFPRFMYSLEESCFSLIPHEEISDDNLTWKHFPVGAGPYKIISTNSEGTRVVLMSISSNCRNSPKQVEFCSFEHEMPDIIVNPDDLNAPADFAAYTGSGLAFITGIFFNYLSSLGENTNFRRALAAAIDRSALTPVAPHINPTTCFIGNPPRGMCDAQKSMRDCHLAQRYFRTASTELGINVTTQDHSIGIYRYNIKSPAFSWIQTLSKQLQHSGFRNEMYTSTRPFFDPSDHSSPFWIARFIPSNRDPVVLLQVFSEGGPSIPILKIPDLEYEKELKKARSLPSGKKRDQSIGTLLQRFSDQAYAIPLFSIRNKAFIRKHLGLDVTKALVGWGFYVERLIHP
jgi:ABC-type oligopeptide transport system substrate-binding subunit